MKRHFVLIMGSCMMLLFFGVAAMSSQSQDLAALFPDMAGWQKKGAAETYAPENLYKYIDGAAENFLNYEFKQLAVQNYANAQGQALTVEIYFHGSPENAFGIYSSEKPTGGNYFELGSQGYAEGGILNFICSAYYVKLSGFELGQDPQEVLTDLGRALVSKIDAKAALPKIVQAFPAAGKIANSERFILNDFLGHDFLHKAYVADYLVNGKNFQLFIISAGSEEEARAMLKKYIALDKKNSEPIVTPGTLTINDPYNGPIRILWQGKFICGSSGQNASSIEYLSAMADNLAK
jgi:hypothetical protein